MNEAEDDTLLAPEPTEEEQSIWTALEELKRSNLVLRKALGRQGLENQALHEAIEAIARAQQEGQEKLAEYFQDLEEEEPVNSKKSKKMSKRNQQEVELDQIEDDEEEGFSTTTKMFLSGVAGFAAGSAVTALYFKYGPGATTGATSAPDLTSMQGLTVEPQRNVAQLR